MSNRNTLSRRQLGKLSGGAIAGAYALSSAHSAAAARLQEDVRLTFSLWGQESEEIAFEEMTRRFEEANPNVTVEMEFRPFAAHYESLGTRLAAGEAPDVVRVQYFRVGAYVAEGAFIDLSPYLEPDHGDDFGEPYWAPVEIDGGVYGLPHHTDTFAVWYNTDYFEQLDVRIPTSLEDAWTWDEFIEIAHQVQDETDADYGFVMDWDNAARRWLLFLYQNGGQPLDDELSTPQVNTPEGIETVAWTQSWFTEGLVPPESSVKGGDVTANLFATGRCGMMLEGDWLIPFIQDNMRDYGWDVTYMIRNVDMASDLGGNLLTVTRDSQHPEIAADFVKFLTNPENMRDFVIDAQFIPVRNSLLEEELDYPVRPEVKQVFLDTIAVVPNHFGRLATLPRWSRIEQLLLDELDLAFAAGQSPEDTARNIDDGITAILEE